MATPTNSIPVKQRTPIQTYTITLAGTGTIDAAVAGGAAFDRSFAVTPTVIGAVMRNFKAPFMVAADLTNITVTYVHITPDGITAGSAPIVEVTVMGELGNPS